MFNDEPLTEREMLEAMARHWQDWSARDFTLMETWRETGDADDFNNAAGEHKYDSSHARAHLFKLIDMGKVN